jgi:hypothetical protein
LILENCVWKPSDRAGNAKFTFKWYTSIFINKFYQLSDGATFVSGVVEWCCQFKAQSCSVVAGMSSVEEML